MTAARRCLLLAAVAAGCGRLDFDERSDAAVAPDRPLQMKTFGDAMPGGILGGFTQDVLRASRFVLPEPGFATAIVAYVETQFETVSGPTIRVAIYDADSAGEPQSLRASAERSDPPHPAETVQFPLTAPVLLEPATYWLAIETNDVAIRYDYETVIGAQRRSAHVFTDGPAPMFGAASSDDRQMTIYVEYLAE